MNAKPTDMLQAFMVKHITEDTMNATPRPCRNKLCLNLLHEAYADNARLREALHNILADCEPGDVRDSAGPVSDWTSYKNAKAALTQMEGEKP